MYTRLFWVYLCKWNEAARECEDDACSTDLSVQQVSETWRFLSQKKIL
jgi:hypothetical protein